MSAFDDLLKAHRKKIIDREAATFAELLAEYSLLQRTLKRQLAEIQKIIKEKRESGEEIGRSWVYRERRIKSLLAQIGNEIERFGGTVARVTTREQRAAVQIAFDQVKETVAATAGNVGSIGTMLPTRAIENAVGLMGDGSPIFDYWTSKMAPAVVEKLREQLINAVATGMDLRKLARQLEATGDITKTRAMAMARTEVNRIRRETTRQIFAENSDVITGWEWVCSKSPRTCAVCLALDGRVFKVDQFFPQHINCRCTLIAVIDGVPRPKRQLGSDWFAQQSIEVQEGTLGKEGAAAYRRGEVRLKDFVGWRTDKHFGKSVYTKPLSVVLAGQPVADNVIRTPRDIVANFVVGSQEDLQKLVGRKLTVDEIGGMVGALDGSEIEIAVRGDAARFAITHPLIAQQQLREIGRDWAGRLGMHNEYFRKTRGAPKSIGFKSFATQVYHAEKFGFEFIHTNAAGDFSSAKKKSGFSGYYVWPRYGYNGLLDAEDWEKFPVTFRGIEDLNTLFLQMNGRIVWKEHGTGRTMIFDLDRDSTSWEVFKRYLQEKGFDVEFD